MPDEQTPAGDGADVAVASTEEAATDPFAEFQTEGFERGERAADDEPQDDDPPADPSEEDGDEGAADPPSPTPKPKRLTPAQERINELTRERRTAERKAADLEARLAALEAAREQPPAPKDDPPLAESEPPKDALPSPDDFEFGELDSRYIAALAEYHTDQRWAKLQQEQEQARAVEQQTAAQRAAQEKFRQKIDAAAERYPDYHEKVVQGAERLEWPLSAEMGEMIAESDVGADIAYYLADNPDEAAVVYRQSPLEQARYFGKLEAKFSATQSAADGGTPAGQTAPAKTPKAPPPVLPARGAGGKFQPSGATDDFESFERMVNSGE